MTTLVQPTSGEEQVVASMAPPSSLPTKKPSKLRSSCDSCQLAKIRCSQHKPRCQRCINQDINCVYSLSRRMGRPRRPTTSLITGQEEHGNERPRTPVLITSQTSVHSNVEDQPRKSPKLSRDSRPGAEVLSSTPASIHTYTSSRNFNSGELSPGQNASNITAVFDTANGIGSTLQPDVFSPSQIFESHGTTTSLDDLFFMDASSPGFEYNDLINYLDNPKPSIHSASIDCSPEIPMRSLQAEHLLQTPQNNPSIETISLLTAVHDEHFITEPATHSISHPASGDSMSIDKSISGEDAMMSSSWGSYSNGFLPSQPQSRPTSAIVTTTSGSSASSSVGSRVSRSKSSSSRKCGCHNDLLQKLSVLDDYGPEHSVPTIDYILSYEEETRQLISQILRCSVCLGHRNSLLLLLSIIIDKIVSMLERSTNGKSKTHHHRDSISSNKSNTSRPASRLKKLSMSSQSGDPAAGASSHFTTGCPLMVGVYRVSDEETNRFLKRFLQTRLVGLSALLNQMHQSLQQSQQGGVTRAGSIITLDLQRRLQSVTGRIELWD